MSYELNKLLCALLSALLVYLLASFVSEILYPDNQKKEVKLSYYIKDIKESDSLKDTKQTSQKKEEISKESINNKLKNASLENGEVFVKKNCATCHNLNLPVKNKIGPSLATVLNRKIGSVEGFKYSKVLYNKNEIWDVTNLYLFLENPKGWAPGTKMSYRGILDNKKLIDTIKFLSFNSSNNEN